MFVTGCHRSGTSLLASVLLDAIGVEEDARGGELHLALDNPMGFFESKRLVEMNDLLLQTIGSNWDFPSILAPAWDSPDLIEILRPWRAQMARYALTHQWVDKDPRLCLTYPAYLHLLLRRVPLAAVLREPLAVATSLFARNGIAVEGGLALWFLYNYHLAACLQDCDMLLLYKDMLGAAEPNLAQVVAEALLTFLQGHGYETKPVDVIQQKIEWRVKPKLNRAVEALPQELAEQVNPMLLMHCSQAYEAVGDGCSAILSFKAAFDSLPRVVLQALQKHHLVLQPAPLDPCHPSHSSVDHVEVNRQILLQLEERLRAIQASTSWRITGPLRRLRDGFRLIR